MKESAILKNRIRYVTSGEGEPLILIHGVGLDHTMWQHQLEYFSSYYKVYAYDMIGHGESEKPNKDCYRLEDFTNQLYEFMETLHIDRAHIVGFSMGGMVAQKFGLLFPKKVISLTIANAVANRSEDERKSVLIRVRKVEKEGKNSTIEAAIERWFSPDYIKSNHNTINEIRQRLKANDEKAYLNSYRVFATADKQLWDELHQIQVPVLIITGEYDKGSNPRMAKDMKDQIPNAKIYIVPNVKHMLPVEKASIFNKYVHHFMNQLKEVKNN